MKDSIENKNVTFYRSYRFLLAFVGFFGYMLQYIQKIDMAIGIVCMVNQTAVLQLTNNKLNKTTAFVSTASYKNDSTQLTDDYHNLITSNTCEIKNKLKSEASQNSGSFVWPKDVQGMILSAYFYGYICSQIFAGVLASKFGSKIIIFIGMFGGSFMTLLIPFAARWNYVAVIVVRVLTGITQSFFMPGMKTLWVYWAPPNERSRLIGMSHSGGMIGNIVALLLGGVLCFYGFDGGWPSIFYIFGGLGLIWVVVMIIMFSNTPQTQKFISPLERDYITKETQHSTQITNLVIPWKEIFKSKAAWAIFIAHLTNNWGIYLYMTQLPSFMKEVLKFDIKSNGLMSSIPFVFCWLFISVASIVGDRLIQSGQWKRKTVRKLFNGLGLSIPIVTLVGLSFITCKNPYIGVLLLTIAMAFIGCSLGAGFYVNINDIAGPYSGVVFGISNTFGSIPGLICPYITSIMTKNQSQEEWAHVFILCACVYLAGLVVYSLLCEADVQPWALKVNTSSISIISNKSQSDIENSQVFAQKSTDSPILTKPTRVVIDIK